MGVSKALLVPAGLKRESLVNCREGRGSADHGWPPSDTGYQSAKGWSLRTHGFTSSCLLHAQASASFQLASPGTFSGWLGHLLMAVSEKGESGSMLALFFFLPKLPVSSHLARWPKQVTHHAQCQSGRRLRVSGLRVWITGRPVVGDTIGPPPPLPPSALISPLSVPPLSLLSSAVLLPLY